MLLQLLPSRDTESRNAQKSVLKAETQSENFFIQAPNRELAVTILTTLFPGRAAFTPLSKYAADLHLTPAFP